MLSNSDNWREDLLKSLRENGVTQPSRKSSLGRGLVAVGVLFWACVSGLMLLMLSSGNSSDNPGQPNCYRVAEDQLKAGHMKYDAHAVAVLRILCEESRAQEEGEEAKRHEIFAIAMMIVWPVGQFLYVFFLYKGLRTLTPDAFAELNRVPNRGPVLFLRSFSRDPSDKLTLRSLTLGDKFERSVVKELRGENPVIAVGKPGEKLPPAGAGRLYIPNDRWQPTVLQLLSACHLVLLVYGSTPGVLWEIQSIVEQLEPSKLIVCIPGDRKRNRRNLEGWQEFISLTQDAFPKPLPADPGRALFLHFDNSWQPILVEPRSGVRFVTGRAIRSALRSIMQSKG